MHLQRIPQSSRSTHMRLEPFSYIFSVVRVENHETQNTNLCYLKVVLTSVQINVLGTQEMEWAILTSY